MEDRDEDRSGEDEEGGGFGGDRDGDGDVEDKGKERIEGRQDWEKEEEKRSYLWRMMDPDWCSLDKTPPIKDHMTANNFLVGEGIKTKVTMMGRTMTKEVSPLSPVIQLVTVPWPLVGITDTSKNV